MNDNSYGTWSWCNVHNHNVWWRPMVAQKTKRGNEFPIIEWTCRTGSSCEPSFILALPLSA